MRTRVVAVCALLMGIWMDASAQTATRAVALTFDDLPAAGATTEAEVAAINRTILEALDRHHAPAIGFVIGQRAESLSNSRTVLQAWVQGGRDLGNHTFSHADLNELSPEEFAKDVERGEAAFRGLLPEGRTVPLYLRFPFNHNGDTEPKHQAVRRSLSNRGYEIAVCTIDNSDDVFANAYVRALSGKDEDAARRIRAEYLSHTAAIIDWYTALHQKVFGRETSHVMLLHANRLNADTIESVLGLFESRQFRFVSLADAQSDAAYQTVDTFRTRSGAMWGYRWARSLKVPIDGRLEPEPAPWVAAYSQ